MPLYYVELDYGCGIRKAKNKRQAWSELVKTEGTKHARMVRLATKEDIEHVSSLEGHVPKDE